MPLYLQFCERIRKMILNEEFVYGQALPSERELSAQYGIDRKTIRKAMDLLVDEDMLIRLQGKGTFIKKPAIKYSMEKLVGFTRLLEQEGIKVKSKIISLNKETAGYRLSKIFQIDREAKLYKMIRIRYGDDEPIAYEKTFILDGLIPNFDGIDFSIYSLYDLLEKNGIQIGEIKETVNAAAIPAVEANYLNMEPDSYTFLISDITYDTTGRVIEYNQAFTNSRRIVLTTKLK